MAPEPELDPERIDELHQAVLGGPANRVPPPEPAPTTAGPAALRHQLGRVRVAVRRVLGRIRHQGRIAARGYDPRTVGQISLDLDHGTRAMEARFQELRAEVRGLAVWVGADDHHHMEHRLDTIATNLELLKTELRGAERTFDELGQAIAPGAGLAAAAPRMAELRERVNGIDRQVRQLSPAAAERPATAAERPAPRAAGGSRFDYVGFEHRFRGDPQTVLGVLRDRYLEHLQGQQPVLDVGCGRGELLRTLADHGVVGSGVDLDGGMVSEAIAAGVDAHHGDAIEFLRAQPEGTYGAITAIHVVEHLELELLIEFLDLAASRLKPGGILIAETPNPATLLVLGNSFILDPTHVWPLHPSLLSFLSERAGFRDIELLYGSPAEDYRLAMLPESGATAEVAAALNPSLQRLNEVLFGPQEYAVIARTPW